MIQGKPFRQADHILKQLLTLPEREQAAFLSQSCADDPALKTLVERLLASATADDPQLLPGAGLEMLGVETHDFAPHPLSSFEPGDRVGAYLLERVLGRGGMATVYLATRADGQFEQTVALKVLDRAGESLARFEQERQILASLDHPNTARLLDGGITGRGVPYVAMEYVEGVPLLEYCDRERLGIEQRLKLFNKIVDAVHDAHRKLIVHRDIKSANILVTASGVPKLLDFGIAKLLETDALPSVAPNTRVLVPMTPEYASPEQIRGEPISIGTDIYQLGYLFYVLLTGRTPYAVVTTDIAALVDAITQRDPVPPSRRVADVSDAADNSPWSRRATTRGRLRVQLRGDLDRVVLKTLHKDPDQRYASAAALAADIDNVLADRPVSARPDSVRYRTRKFVKRNALGVGVTASVILSVVIGTSLFTYRLAQEKQKAEWETAKAAEVVTFMRGLFASANPRVTAGETLSAVDILDDGLQRLRSSLDTQPDVKADLLDNVGHAYQELGEFDTAEEVLQESLDLRAAVSGTENEAYIDTLHHMANLIRGRGRYAEAEVLARQAYESGRRVLGDESQLTQYAMATLGLAIYRQSRFQEAEEIHRNRLALTQRTLGEQHPDVASALNNVGITLYMQGRYEEAVAFFEPAHKLGKKVLGEKHPATMDALNNIALNLQLLGRIRQSADTLRQVIALRAEALGEEHPRTLRSRQNLATLLLTLGDNQAAVTVMEELAEARTRVLGSEHPDTLWTRQDLARGYAGLGSLQEAEAILQVLLEQRVRILGEDHHDSILSRYHLGSVLRRNGKYPEAERQLLKALDLSRKSEDASAEDILYDQLELGWVYLDSDEIGQAATILQTAVEQLDSVEPGGQLYGVVMRAWGETLRRQGELADAERALLDALGVLSSIFEKDNPWVQETATSLAALYTARGQPDEAERYRQLTRLVEQP